MEIPYKVEHRKVKYPRLEFKGLQLLVILPPEMDEPSKLIEKRKTWILRKWNTIQEAIKRAGTPTDFTIFGETYTIETTTEKPRISHSEKKIYLDYRKPRHLKIIYKQLRTLMKLKAKLILKEYAAKLGFKANKILIRRLETKWGSCSTEGNITLNLKLVCLPEQIIRYVIFHEVTHLKQKRHNQLFWQMIRKEYPDYKEYEKKLLEYWFATELLFQNLIKPSPTPIHKQEKLTSWVAGK
jgi:predicted metal-dependent hydrolase